MAKDPVVLSLGHGVEDMAGKGATLQQVQGGVPGLEAEHEEHMREEEEQSCEAPHGEALPPAKCGVGTNDLR